MNKKIVLCVSIACMVNILMATEGYRMLIYKQGEELEIYKKEGKKYYKFWGLDYCLGYSKKLRSYTLEARRIDEQNALLRNVVGEEAFEELKNYIDKNVKFKNLYFCISMVYDSKEYEDEIKRIVKKYCKDCE